MRLFRKLLWLVPLTLSLVILTPAQEAPAPAAEHHVSKAEAKELFRSVDDILQFASDHTGLPILHSVKKKLATREEVAKYIEARLEEQGNGERFDRSALSLKKLGLLPRDFNLREYMLGLYKEQVEGWYDAHKKTVYLLDWVDPDVQKPVMAHELVHALQDQSYDLDKWLNVHKDSKDDTAQMLLDEQRTARQSIVEGQAMIVLFDYQLAPAGQSVESAPALVDSMKSSMLDEPATPMYAKAPIYLREAMLFPYTYGMEFVRDILVKRGKQAAFAGVLDNPPLDTHQIMQPAAYLAAQPETQIKVVPLEKVLGCRLATRGFLRPWRNRPSRHPPPVGWTRNRREARTGLGRRLLHGSHQQKVAQGRATPAGTGPELYYPRGGQSVRRCVPERARPAL